MSAAFCILWHPFDFAYRCSYSYKKSLYDDHLYEFLAALKRQKPLLAVQGNIFDTPADHVAFAVHWPNKEGHYNNNDGGFSSRVAEYGWPELAHIRFEKGKPQSQMIKGKMFHALPVHTPEKGGWDETPQLIESCLNQLPISSSEVIACVLIGGGHAGKKFKASITNLEGMVRTLKTVVLYVYNSSLYDLMLMNGIVAQPLPYGIPLGEIPKPVLYRDRNSYLELLEKAGVEEGELVETG